MQSIRVPLTSTPVSVSESVVYPSCFTSAARYGAIRLAVAILIVLLSLKTDNGAGLGDGFQKHLTYIFGQSRYDKLIGMVNQFLNKPVGKPALYVYRVPVLFVH